jgi:hypothetical protein
MSLEELRVHNEIVGDILIQVDTAALLEIPCTRRVPDFGAFAVFGVFRV